MRRRSILWSGVIAAVLAPLTMLATAWGPATSAASLPSAAGLQAAADTPPTWSHPRGRAWLLDGVGRDPDHRTLWWTRGVPAPAGIAGATGDAVEPAPWWSRLRHPPTDAEMPARVIFEAAWGWPVPMVSMSVPVTPLRPTDWAAATDSRTFGTPPGRVRVLPTRPIWRGIAIAALVQWLVLFPIVFALSRFLAVAAGTRGRRRRLRGACVGCGHQLLPAADASGAAGRCPECGREVVPGALAVRAARGWRSPSRSA